MYYVMNAVVLINDFANAEPVNSVLWHEMAETRDLISLIVCSSIVIV